MAAPSSNNAALTFRISYLCQYLGIPIASEEKQSVLKTFFLLRVSN